MWTVDTNLRFTTNVGAGLKKTNLRPNELVGKTLNDLFETDDPDASVIREHRQALRGEMSDYELTWDDRRFQAVVEPFRDADGTIVGCVGIALDVTEQKLAEDELRISEARYRSLLENHVDAVGLVVDGRIVYANDRMTELTGYTRRETVGRSPVEFLAPEDRQRAGRKITDIYSGDNPTPAEYQLIHKNGGALTVEVVSHVIEHAGQPALLSVLRDVTKRRDLEQRTQKLQLQLAHLQRVSSIGEMATTLAHELNQPLAAIANYVEGCVDMLQKQSIDQKEVAAVLERVAQLTLRSGKVIDRVRKLARKEESHRSSADINELTLEVVGLMEHELQLAGVIMRVDVTDDLPLISVDAIQIQQVLMNIIRNAVDAMRHASQPRELMIKTSMSRPADVADQVDQYIEVTIRDVGTGIVNIEDAFAPFATTKADGLGMGLSISRSLVEIHGGRLWAERNADRGTTFHFTVPALSSRLEMQAT